MMAVETGAKLQDESASALADDRALDREAGEKGEFLGPWKRYRQRCLKR